MYMGANKITFIDLLCIELCATSKVSVEGCLVMTVSPAIGGEPIEEGNGKYRIVIGGLENYCDGQKSCSL